MKKYFSLKNSEGAEIRIGIVKNYSKGFFSHYYNLFPLENTLDTFGVIGVKNKDNFAVCFHSKINSRFAWSIYLDGINVIQNSGIQLLNKIPEDQRSAYNSHQKFVGNGLRSYFSDCFVQANDENRKFTFTQQKGAGINEILIQDPFSESRIDIYVWGEDPNTDIDELPAWDLPPYPRSKIGAGEATYKKFSEGRDLDHPVFLGKVSVLHQPAEKLTHLGETLIPERKHDPMNKVPRS